MSIFLTETDRVIVQGMTGSEGRKHTTRMLSAGTKVVAGVNPRKAGPSVAFDVAPIGPVAGEVQAGTVEVPVYGTVAEAKEATAERDAREKAELTRALGLESDGKIPAALRAQIRQLEEDQKRRAKRARTDVLDRAMIDLLSFYRDVLTTRRRRPGRPHDEPRAVPGPHRRHRGVPQPPALQRRPPAGRRGSHGAAATPGRRTVSAMPHPAWGGA